MRTIVLSVLITAFTSAGLPMAFSAEPASPAKPPVVAPLPVPDAKLPLLFDLYIGPLSNEDLAKYTRTLQGPQNRDYKTGFAHLPGQPFMFGFTLVNGQPIKPFSRLMSLFSGGGRSMDGVPDVGHCAYGRWEFTGGPALLHRDEFHAFTVERQGDSLRGACHFTATQTAELKTELKMTWTARIVNSTQVEGQAEVTWGSMVVTRPLTGIVRQGLDDLIDPLNCLYQVTGETGKNGVWAVVEVKDGKPVRSQGYVRGQSEIRLRKMNADSLRITRHDHGVNGWKADLEGSIGIEGGPTLALAGAKIGVNGVGWGGQGVKVRAYHPQHPVARGWEDLAKVLFTQTAVPAETAERARRQALALPALPPPGPAAKYHYKHRGYTSIYAPWLDFQAVDQAVQYRFNLFNAGVNGTLVDLKQGFTVPTPRADLGPVWLAIPVNRPQRVHCTALDAAGNPLGEAQVRMVTRKAFYGEPGAVGATLPLPLAEMAALRSARISSQWELGLAPLWEHLVRQGIPVDTWGLAQVQPDLWLPLVAGGSAGYERDLARTVASHYGRWLDQDRGKFPMGVPYAYGSRYYFAPQIWMPKRLDQYELSRDPQTGAPSVYEASLPQATPEVLRGILQRLTKLQQPSGGWSAADVKHSSFPVFYGGASMFGIPWLDFNTGSFLNIAGRLRRGYGCTGEALALELKGQHWLDRNALRTGWWECQEQQGSPDERTPTVAYHLLPYILYLLETAPAQLADLDKTETLARFAEDCYMNWTVEPGFSVRYGEKYMYTVARIFLRLHQRTGDPLWLAKAEALFAQRLRLEEPVWGLLAVHLRDGVGALAYLQVRREIAATPPAPPVDPAQAHVVLTLDRLLERAERAVVHLAISGGTVRQAFVTTPTRQPIDVDFTQPGRVHVHADTVLHHPVDAGGLKIGKDTITGELVLRLAGEAQPLKVAVSLKPDHRLWRGTWTWGDQIGRAAAEARTAAVTKPKRAHVELCHAVTGGEPWQNWAMAMWDLNGDGAMSATWLGNNNAGWSTTIQESSLKVTDTQVEAALRMTVGWDGVAEVATKMEPGNPHAANPSDGALIQEWREGKKAWLANWQMVPGEGRGTSYQGGFSPPPGYITGNNGVFRYQTSFKPVTAGTYTYRFTGHRLGDVLTGTVTVTKPDGGTVETKFLGGIE